MKHRLTKIVSSPFIRIGVPVVISLVSLYLALKDVALDDVLEALSNTDVRFIVLVLITVMVNTFAKAARWKALMRPGGHNVSYFQAIKSLLVGHTLNLLYPGRVGDLSRAYEIGGLGLGRTFVLGTVVVEKILDMLSYAFLFIYLLFLIPLPGWVSDSGYAFTGVALIVSFATIIIAFQRDLVMRIVERITDLFPERIKTYTNTRFRSGITSLDVLQNKTDVLILGLLSALVWATAILNNHLTLLAFDISLPLSASLLILIALQVGITIPSVPGRFGVFQYICVLALGVFGVDQATAFSYGILLHIIVILLPTLFGLVILAISGYSKAPTEPHSRADVANSTVTSEGIQPTAGHIERSERN